ncbi:MAG TPA: vitamin K epoxide reductase family protein, partial [Pyrinomonadaceae bacterium]|nr:vitamin K epoxide reductase family protein [Pyrinomonadaceae bacterium]
KIRKTMNNLAKKQNETQELRRELQESNEQDLSVRRAIIGLSLVGMSAMTAVSLFQTGIIEHLPDPPIKDFDSDKVNSSDTAYALGVPDGTLSLASLAANIPIAAFGGANRAETQPLVPLAAAAKASVEAVVAGWYFYQMPTKEKKWCGYCIVGALANFGIAALSLVEAKKAWKVMTK